MFRIVSCVGRSWPHHGFHIKVGDNEFQTLNEQQLAFLQPFTDAAQMVIVIEPTPEGQSPEKTAQIADTVRRIRDEAAADSRAKRALEIKAQAVLGTLTGNLDGAPDAATIAKLEAEDKAKGGKSANK